MQKIFRIYVSLFLAFTSRATFPFLLNLSSLYFLTYVWSTMMNCAAPFIYETKRETISGSKIIRGKIRVWIKKRSRFILGISFSIWLEYIISLANNRQYFRRNFSIRVSINFLPSQKFILINREIGNRKNKFSKCNACWCKLESRSSDIKIFYSD